jgi:hypothetical protein
MAVGNPSHLPVKMPPAIGTRLPVRAELQQVSIWEIQTTSIEQLSLSWHFWGSEVFIRRMLREKMATSSIQLVLNHPGLVRERPGPALILPVINLE